MFATLITFWDTASIVKNQKSKLNNDLIFGSSGLEEVLDEMAKEP